MKMNAVYYNFLQHNANFSYVAFSLPGLVYSMTLKSVDGMWLNQHT